MEKGKFGFIDYRPKYFTRDDGSGNPNIYDSDGNLILQLSTAGNYSYVTGRNTSGDDRRDRANSVNAYPYIEYLGNSYIALYSNAEIHFLSAGTFAHKHSYSAGLSISDGSNTTGRTHRFKCNTADTYPYIDAIGNSNLEYNAHGDHIFYYDAVYLGKLTQEKTLMLLETSTPTPLVNNGQFYTKNDNKAYFQDGAGVEHELAYVP